MPAPVTICSHPLAQHLLTQLRDKTTAPDRFRFAANTLSTLLVLEATRELAMVPVDVETPMAPHLGVRLAEPLAAVPVLRAGLAMLEPLLALFPDVAVGYIGLERDEQTAVARSYYAKLPPLEGRVALCLDPMLATGGSAAHAIRLLKEAGAGRVKMVSVISAPEGIARLQEAHPDVPIVTTAVDERLDERSYIIPGLGDFGDRLYGTH